MELASTAANTSVEPLHSRLEFENFLGRDCPEIVRMVKGTTILASQIVALVLDGWSWKRVKRKHPELTRDDVRACVLDAMGRLPEALEEFS